MKRVMLLELMLVIVVLMFTTNLYAQNLGEIISDGGVGLLKDTDVRAQPAALSGAFKVLASLPAVTDSETDTDILTEPWVPSASFKVYTYFDYNSYADNKVKVTVTNSAGVSGSIKFGPYTSQGPGGYYFWVELTGVPIDYYTVKTTIINTSTGASKSASVKLSVQ